MKTPVKFGKYYLLERISVGGMAEVFKAKSFGEAGFERLVAVKRILPSIAEDSEFIAMFVDEAKLAVQLTHSNIAQIFELGKVGESYFIALEYVSGKDMRAIFERARKNGEHIPIPMACYMVMKLCEGLDYAHNKKDAAGRSLELVHRDVSPQNILVSHDGDVKLIDFGIAKAASKSSKTQAGILKGKFGYMSPEQVRGLQVDRRSDVFAAGICLYELLTMERLFSGESDFSTLEKVRNVEIMPPTTYNKKVPEELEAYVLKALAKHPEDRYRTAMDLHDDLQSFMYTSGNFFSRKDLGAYMHRLFDEEISREAARDEEYRKFDSRKANDLEALESTAVQQSSGPMPAARPSAPALPGARGTAPPPPPPMSARPGRATVMGTGTPPPPLAQVAPPPMRAASATASAGAATATAASVEGAAARVVAPAVALPPPATLPAPDAAQAEAMDMDWDEEELATQVYDKPPEMLKKMVDGAKAARTPAPPPSNASALRSTTGIPQIPQIPAVPSLPSRPASMNASMSVSAPPPPPATSLPSAPMPATSLPAAAMPAPAVAAPAVAAPPVAPPSRPSSPQPSTAPIADANAFSAGFAASAPPAGAPAPTHRDGYSLSGPPRPSARPEPRKEERKAGGMMWPLAVLGVIATAAAVILALNFARGAPTGGILVSTNVEDATLFVDNVAHTGTGSRFELNEVPAGHVHRIELRKVGYVARSQEINVHEGQTLVMEMPLTAEAPPAPPVALPVPTPPVAVPTPAVAEPTPPVPAPPVVAANPPPQQVITPPPVVAPAPPAPVAVRTTPRTTPRHTEPAAAAHTATPRPTPTPAPAQNTVSFTPTPPAGGGATGVLLLSTTPSANCTISGHGSHNGPWRVQLPPGSYRVQCRNDAQNLSAEFPFTITAGGTADLRNRSL